MYIKAKICLIFLLCFSCRLFTSAQNKAAVTVNFDKQIGGMKPIWAWFGYDEPNYTYMKDGQKLLTDLSKLSPVPVFVRTHNLLTSGDGTPALKWGSTNVYTEDANGNPIYDWTIVDRIFDTYVKRGMKPLAQIGFMPEALSTKPQPYQHKWKPGTRYEEILTGWAYPPKDYQKWRNLVYEWVKHCVARYGQKEVESWYWEVWNEADGAYWKGTQAEFFKLYDYAADGLKRALPTAKIGGANVTGGGSRYLDAFIKHCLSETNYATGKIGSPLDAVLFHAKGAPKVVNGIVVMNLRTEMRNVEANYKVIAKYQQLKNIPVIIGEFDPEGCAACGMSTNPENAYRNGTMYSSYTAASFARLYELTDQYKINLLGAVSWSFEFENQPWFAGFRDLATNGINKPVLNVFKMFGMMSGNRVVASSNHMYPLQTVLDSSIRKTRPDIGVLAAKAQNSSTVLIWNYHDEDKKGNIDTVSVSFKGLGKNPVFITRFVIDDLNSNAYEAWKKMGAPQSPTASQIQELEKSSQLKKVGKPIKVNTETANYQFELNRQGVTLLQIK